MPDIASEIRALMRRVRKRGELPSSRDIVRETFQALGYVPEAVEPNEAINRFNEILRQVWEETLPVLERYEQDAYAEGIPRELADTYPALFEKAGKVAEARGFRAGVMKLLSSWYPLLRRCFLSVSQSRMVRGGKDFELQIEGLLDLAGVPYDRQEVENRTDLVLPDVEAHRRNRNISAIVSVKRTLRERWAEVAEELFNLRSPNVFLFTADEGVSATHVERICGEYNIHLVVWDHMKEDKFLNDELVLGYTQWATQRLTVLRQYWNPTDQ